MPTVHLNDIDVHYALLGQPDGLPLVLIHGFVESLDDWRPQVQALGRYRLVLYDIRGHGETSAPVYMDRYSLSIYAGDLKALLDALGIERTYVLGTDLGGAIALQFALTHPHMVTVLILADTLPAFDRPDYDAPLRAQQQRLLNDETLARRRGMEVLAQQRWQETVEANPGLARDAGAERTFVRRHAAMDRFGYLGAIRAQREREDLLPRLHELAMPVLVIAGENDPRTAGAELIHWAIRHSRFAVIDGAGTSTHTQRPAAFNQAVLDFLDAVEGRNMSDEGRRMKDERN